jgi:hypothetical protein
METGNPGRPKHGDRFPEKDDNSRRPENYPGDSDSSSTLFCSTRAPREKIKPVNFGIALDVGGQVIPIVIFIQLAVHF